LPHFPSEALVETGGLRRTTVRRDSRFASPCGSSVPREPGALPPDQPRWAFEAKWDGYRALAHAAAGQVRLRSRQGVDMTGWFPELTGLPAALEGHAAVLDGEVVALDADGRPDFEALQRRMGTRAGVRRGRPVAYLFFDLLWLDGRLLCPAPYAERRRLLDDLGVAGPAWQPVASFPGQGTALLAATRAQGLEGVVAKRLDSPYLPGRRSRLWLKVKHYEREAFVVGGFVPATGGPPAVAALLVGTPDPARPGRLRFAGRVGCGSPAGSTTAWSRPRAAAWPSGWPRWWCRTAPSSRTRRRWPAAAGGGPAARSRRRCSCGRSWPSRSPSSAGRPAACATPPSATSASIGEERDSRGQPSASRSSPTSTAPPRPCGARPPAPTRCWSAATWST
jgi:bifunctional non-homologous end joining protein LigD